jgi:hypothetical protein
MFSASVLTFLAAGDCPTTVDSQLNSVGRYSIRADPRENTVFLLMWVERYHLFHCSGTVRLAPELVATPLPTDLLLLRDVVADVFLCMVCKFCYVDKLFTVT